MRCLNEAQVWYASLRTIHNLIPATDPNIILTGGHNVLKLAVASEYEGVRFLPARMSLIDKLMHAKVDPCLKFITDHKSYNRQLGTVCGVGALDVIVSLYYDEAGELLVV